MRRFSLVVCGLATALAVTPLAAQIGLPINPQDFVREVDNPYFPLEPGTAYFYEGTEGSNVVEVTHKTKKILGVRCTEVRDRAYDEDGLLVEDTLDWYAQDRDGNVWYFGEDTIEYLRDDDGNVIGTSTAGTWRAGKDGALPGFIMLADPQAGDQYQQEVAPGVAEDMAEVLGYVKKVTVPYGRFRNVLLTAEWTPLAPGVLDHKYYARGIGFIRSVVVEGGDEVSELVDIRTDDDDD